MGGKKQKNASAYKSPPQYVRTFTEEQPESYRDFDTYVSSHSSLWTKEEMLRESYMDANRKSIKSYKAGTH